MEYTTLGTSGLKVSRVCLGTMTFGGQSDAEESGRIVRAAMDKGVNFIDTANIYPVMKGGVSESIVGESLRGVRDQVVLATKAGGRMGRGVNDSGLSRAHLVRSVEDSLRRLQTDYIDVFYLHFPDPATPIEETIQTMDMLVRSGKIRYYGLSNYSAWQCCDAVHKAGEMGCLAPVVTESVYNFITRGLDDEMVPFLKQSGMGLAVYNPLAGGLLTGKHTRDHAEANSRYDSDRGYRARYWKERNWDAIEELVRISADCGMSPIQLSLGWLLSHDYVSSIICGASRCSHIEENLSYAETRLEGEVLERCDKLWDLIRGDFYSYHH